MQKTKVNVVFDINLSIKKQKNATLHLCWHATMPLARATTAGIENACTRERERREEKFHYLAYLTNVREIAMQIYFDSISIVKTKSSPHDVYDSSFFSLPFYEFIKSIV